jgi:hypothetical protein
MQSIVEAKKRYACYVRQAQCRWLIVQVRGLRCLCRCPSLVIIKGEDLTKYREFSERIYGFFKTRTTKIERLVQLGAAHADICI